MPAMSTPPPTPRTPRTPAVRQALERRARALREAGRAMADVERETGVPVSTLYQWAARGGWRACDLAEAAVREVMGRAPAESGAEDGGAEDGGAKTGEPLTPDQLRAEAEACARAAMALSRHGRMKEAEAALKLAERYRALADGGAGAGVGGAGVTGAGAGGLGGLSANEALILTRARLRHAPHVLFAIRRVVRADEKRARKGRKLMIEYDYGHGPFATPEQAAAFRAAAQAGPVTAPAPLPVWDLPEPGG